MEGLKINCYWFSKELGSIATNTHSGECAYWTINLLLFSMKFQDVENSTLGVMGMF